MEQFNLSVDSLQARELTNYYFKNSRLQMRPAVAQLAYQAALPTVNVVWFDSTTLGAGGQRIALLLNGEYYRLDTGALLGNIGGAANSAISTCKHGNLDMLIGARRPRIKTSPFTAYVAGTGVLPGVIAPDSITAACSHKGRLYYAAGTVIDYGTPGQVLGTMPVANTFDFASLLDGQTIRRIFSVSGQTGTGNDALFAIFGTGGKVLVYAGDSPGSANWGLVGNYNMPSLRSNNVFAEIDGDIFVAGEDYCYWFKDLLQGGAQSAYENSPTRDIQNIWKAFAPNSCWHISEMDVIVCMVVSGSVTTFNILSWANYGVYTSVGDNYFGWLVYHKTLKCFTFWAMPPTVTVCGAQEVDLTGSGAPKSFYFPGLGSILQLDLTKAVDVTTLHGTIPIETSWKTPYFAPFEGVGNKVNAVRVWFENTISGYFEKVRAIFDYSDYNSPLGWYTQSTVTQINPGNYGDGKDDAAAVASNQYHPLIGASGNGGGVSFQFTQKAKSGSSTTQNQSIYAATAYVEEAGELW
jgi:hypothetical protein